MADTNTPNAAETYSFRDPRSRVSVGDRVLRTFEPGALEDITGFLDSNAYKSLVDRGLLIEPLSVNRADDGRMTMEHSSISPWTYPYEWSWTMLRDAATAHLDVQLTCADEGIGLSDATSFNMTFVGSQPIFIDYGSFVARRSDEPWWAYTDFCEHFLYPLMVTAYTGAELAPVLRGGLGRLSTGDAHSILRSHKRKRGVIKHVVLPHIAVARADMSVSDVESNTTEMTDEIYRNILTGLRKLIDSLEPKKKKSTWSGYSTRDHYTDDELTLKASFVEDVCRSSGADIVLDMGANDGYFARVAARTARTVVAADADHEVIDALYRSGPPANILPVVVEATNPSPAMGWRSSERSAFGERVRPNLVLALAVLHHISLSGNVPLEQIAGWMADFEADFVVEFVHRDDPKVQHLLKRKTDPNSFRYGLAEFLEATSHHFTLATELELPSGTRTMLHLTRIG